MANGTTFSWISSARTDVGRVRKINEDACLDRSLDGLWVVADGMGGHAAGDVASRRIIEEMQIVDTRGPLSAVVTEVEARLMAVNDELRELASNNNISTIGSTFAGLAIADGFGVCMWVGDSRVYRVRYGDIEQISQDHAFVEDLVEKGILRREDAATHPQSNLVTRAVGAQEQLKLDLEIFEIQHEDTYILCSDGLDKEVSESDIAEMTMREDPSGLGDELVTEALDRGARDNVTVVTITVRDPNQPALARPPIADFERSAAELAPEDDEDIDADAKTDFGRLAKSAHVTVDDEDVTVRRDDGPAEDSGR